MSLSKNENEFDGIPNPEEQGFVEDETEDAAVSRTLEWWQAALLMTAETISIGVLGIPKVFATIGLVPGIIIVAAFGLITTYTGYVLGQFKARHPQIYNGADVGRVLFGPVGYYAFALVQLVYYFFGLGSHIVTFVDAFDQITSNGTCSIVFSIVGVVLYIAASAPPTLRGVWWLSMASFISIISALLIVTISTGLDYHHASRLPPLPQKIQIFPAALSFPTAFAAAAQLAFGYAGHITFFAIISDFRDPHHYPRSLFTLQALATSIYITIPTLLYIFVGPAVPSPALGAAGPTASKIAYGIALVTILGSGAIIGHICAKLMFQLVCRTLRGRRARRADEDAVLSPERGRGVWVWVGCILLTWSVSWVVSESVPDLSALLSLISALFVSWFTFGLSNVMWFHMNWSGRAGFWREGGWKTRGLVGVNVGILGIAAVLFGVGIYASGIGVGKASGSGSWSCGKSG